MTRVLAREEGEWVLATIEGPRSLRLALRQSIPATQLQHSPDQQVWRIQHSAWPTACLVFSRFAVPIVWATAPLETVASTEMPIGAGALPGAGEWPSGDSAPLASAVTVEIPAREDAMQEKKDPAFSVTIRSAGLDIEREVDSATAWSILALLLSRETATSRGSVPDAATP
jgi:hypothetical protein